MSELTPELAHWLATDPVGYYSWLTAGCRDPDRMRWVFAAISPPYRAHLNRMMIIDHRVETPQSSDINAITASVRDPTGH